MRTKKGDVKYCGVRKKTIQFADPKLKKGRMNLFSYFVQERYKIHLRKDVSKKPKPWTRDPVFQQYRFTNVRREHDRETRWVIEHITSNPDLCYADKLLNCILFRLFNKHETSELISQPIPFHEHEPSEWNPESYRHLFKEALEEDPERVFFTGAFMTAGLRANTKRYLPEEDPENDMNMRMLWFMKYAIQKGIIRQILRCKSQNEVVDALCSYSGIGKFLGYQIFVDFTYIKEFPFSENEYTIAGPGCVAGLEELFEDRDGMTWEECLFYVRDNWTYLNQDTVYGFNPGDVFTDLDTKDRFMNVMSLENCFCEFSKYVKARHHKGRPRQRYKGV